MVRKALLLAVAIAPFLVALSCREPTQILLEITTDVPCSDVASAGGVAIRVGTPATVDDSPTTRLEATSCATNGTIGSLAIVPSGSDDQVAILLSVATKIAPVTQTRSTDCSAAAPGNCVLARRVLRYVSHTTLPLPVKLSTTCAGVRCPSTQTCVEGTCADAQIQCTESGCSPPAPPVDAGPTKDAAIPADAQSDGGCSGDLTNDPKNCGKCGFVCPSNVCVAGVCKVVPAPALSQLDGCLALTKSHVVWTGFDGTVGHGYTAPKVGATTYATNEPSPIGTAQNVAASPNSASYVASVPPVAPTGYLVHVVPPAIGSGTIVPSIRWISRNDADKFCMLRSSLITCSGAAQNTSTAADTVATGATTWAALTSGKLHVGSIANGANDNQTVGLAAGTSNWITSRRGTDTYYFDIGKEVWSAVAQPPAVPVPQNLFAGQGNPILGMVHDALTDTLYWVEGTPGKYSIFARKTTAPPTRVIVSSLPLNALGTRVCIDVDDKAVYFLQDGIPHMVAK